MMLDQFIALTLFGIKLGILGYAIVMGFCVIPIFFFVLARILIALAEALHLVDHTDRFHEESPSI